MKPPWDLTLDLFQKITPTMTFSAKVVNQLLTIAFIPIKKIAEVKMELEFTAQMSQQQAQSQQLQQRLQQLHQAHQLVCELQLCFLFIS
jgi:hypothetical protein